MTGGACQSADAVQVATTRVRPGAAACLQMEMRPVHTHRRSAVSNQTCINDITTNGFNGYGSARKLYGFQIDKADAYG